MALSNDLISQFVKLTNDKPEAPKSTIAYGTVVEADGSKWVRLDGSPDGLLTPIETTTDVSQDDRVIVDIKDHTAVVTGNLTTPAINKDSSIDNGDGSSTKISDLGIVIADKISTNELSAEVARIDTLYAKNVEIEGSITANKGSIDELTVGVATVQGELTATKGTVDELDAKVVNVEDTLTAANAKIDTLEANDADFKNVKADYANFKSTTTSNLEAKAADIEHLKTDKLDANWANIDYANMEMARVEDFFAKSGVIQNFTSDGVNVTGEIIGVTIKGDLIEGGTIFADKLVIAGEDGLYYQLNASGISTDSKDDDGVTIEQTEYNSLNGRIITAKSITAEQIRVSDLFAFDATLGGFNIDKNSIHSLIKDDEDNTIRGIYLDNDGQIAFGDSNNYIKFYKEETLYGVIVQLNYDPESGEFLFDSYSSRSDDVMEHDMTNWTQIALDKYTSDGEQVWFASRPGQLTKTDTLISDLENCETCTLPGVYTTTGEQVSAYVRLSGFEGSKRGYFCSVVSSEYDEEGVEYSVTNSYEVINTVEEYVKTDTVIDSVEGTLLSGIVTTTGEQVYSYEGDENIEACYYCVADSIYYIVDIVEIEDVKPFIYCKRVAYKLRIAAEDIIFTGSTMDEITSLTEHMKIGTYTDPNTGETNPSVELYEDDSDSTNLMTNKRNVFKDGDVEKTSIGQDGITTDGGVRHVVNTEEYKGQYIWATRANGNFGLMWKDVIG